VYDEVCWYDGEYERREPPDDEPEPAGGSCTTTTRRTTRHTIVVGVVVGTRLRVTAADGGFSRAGLLAALQLGAGDWTPIAPTIPSTALAPRPVAATRAPAALRRRRRFASGSVSADSPRAELTAAP